MLIVVNFSSKTNFTIIQYLTKKYKLQQYFPEGTFRNLPGKYIAMHYQIFYSSTTLGLIWIGLILYSMDLII